MWIYVGQNKQNYVFNSQVKLPINLKIAESLLSVTNAKLVFPNITI